MTTAKSFGWGVVGVIGWAIEHWFITLILVGAIIAGISAAIPNESDHIRPGYTDTGDMIGEQDCLDKGGEVVGDVCYRTVTGP